MNTSSISLTLTNQPVREVSYKVLLDLNNSGAYATDISSYVESIDYIQSDLQLKANQGEVIGKPSVNTASLTLINNEGEFSPNNSENMGAKVNTPIKILAGFIDPTDNSSKTRVLFAGIITAFNATYSNTQKTMVLTLKDTASILQKRKNPNHAYKNGRYYEGAIFNSTISDAVNFLISYSLGISYQREIQALTTIFPIIEFPSDKYVWETLQSLAVSVDARCYFEDNVFKFITPMSLDYNVPLTSQFTFTASNIMDFTESVDKDNVYNKFKITSNPKTMQGKQIIVGSPNFSEVTAIETYKFNDGKNALGIDNRTITLKSQADDGINWIDTINVPLIKGQTLSDLITTATITTNMSGIDNDFLVISKVNTDGGINVKLVLVDPVTANNTITSVTAGTGTYADPYVITVTLRRNTIGVAPNQTVSSIVSTANDVIAVINNDTTANKVVIAQNIAGSPGTGVVTTYTSFVLLMNTPAQSDVNEMNSKSLIKLWNMNTGNQITIHSVDTNAGTILSKDDIDPTNYNLQVTYQYLPHVIMPGKYKWFEFSLDKISSNIDLPTIKASNPVNDISLVISDWQILDGYKRIKFKLTNNETNWTNPIPVASGNLCTGGTPISSGDTVYSIDDSSHNSSNGTLTSGSNSGDSGGL